MDSFLFGLGFIFVEFLVWLVFWGVGVFLREVDLLVGVFFLVMVVLVFCFNSVTASFVN